MVKMSIEDIKGCELGILDHINEICKKNQILFFLDAGTLLGAIRHKGFIPWDDDIDIAMPRHDYNRFCNIMAESSGKYQISTYLTDQNCIIPFAKVFDSKTKIEWKNKYPKEPKYGVWVDVFPIDNVPDNRVVCFLYQTILARIQGLYEHQRNEFIEKKSLKNKILQSISKVFPVSGYIRFLDRYASKYQDRETKNVMNIFGMRGSYQRIDRQILMELSTKEFEGREMPVPEKYDRYLRMVYGEYMELPPVEKRVNLHVIDAFTL